MARLAVLRYCSYQRAPFAPHRVVPSSSPTGDEQFPFFTNSSSFWERRMMEERSPSSLLFISLPTQQSTLWANSVAHLSPATQLVRPPPPPGFRGGRPVSVGTIGKQRPKMSFPVSFPSPMSKYSNGPWKNAMRPQFLFVMIFIAVAATSSAAKI